MIGDMRPPLPTLHRGIINPITGKRFVKSWLIDELIPAADQMYKELSSLLSAPIYERFPIYKILYSIKEQNDFAARTTGDGYAEYMRSDLAYLDSRKIVNPYGAFVIKKGGKLNTKLFLKTYRQYLKDRNLLVEEEFTTEQAIGSKSRVIFCNGYEAARTQLFKDLEWQIVKGEYLTVRIKDFYADSIISGDTTISPTGEQDIYYAGATYQWHYETTAPTAQYKEEVIASLHKTIAVDFEVLYHGAGIRPAVKTSATVYWVSLRVQEYRNI